jgi:hypothetical protein
MKESRRAIDLNDEFHEIGRDSVFKSDSMKPNMTKMIRELLIESH